MYFLNLTFSLVSSKTVWWKQKNDAFFIFYHAKNDDNTCFRYDNINNIGKTFCFTNSPALRVVKDPRSFMGNTLNKACCKRFDKNVSWYQ